MTYVQKIEPRLTAYREAAPAHTAEALVEWLRDLEEETVARLEAIGPETLRWRPHPDANNVSVTVWHLCRWFDYLANETFAVTPRTQLWYRTGWHERTGYDPAGVGFLGAGALTGYTVEEMRAVPDMTADELCSYLRESVSELGDVLQGMGECLFTPTVLGLTPYQIVSGALQGAFGHVGEIDTIVSLEARLRPVGA